STSPPPHRLYRRGVAAPDPRFVDHARNTAEVAADDAGPLIGRALRRRGVLRDRGAHHFVDPSTHAAAKDVNPAIDLPRVTLDQDDRLGRLERNRLDIDLLRVRKVILIELRLR